MLLAKVQFHIFYSRLRTQTLLEVIFISQSMQLSSTAFGKETRYYLYITLAYGYVALMSFFLHSGHNTDNM